MEKSIKKIDKSRVRSRTIVTEKEWGEPSSYHMVINTTGHDIKTLAKFTANAIKELK